MTLAVLLLISGASARAAAELLQRSGAGALKGGCYRRDRRTERTDGRTPDRYIDPAPIRSKLHYLDLLWICRTALSTEGAYFHRAVVATAL